MEVQALVRSHANHAHIYLNAVLSDGKNAVATRYSTDPDLIESLYINTGTKYFCDDDGVCHMLEQEGKTRAVLVSSEPLNDGAGWEAVPKNHMALISADRLIQIQPLTF